MKYYYSFYFAFTFIFALASVRDFWAQISRFVFLRLGMCAITLKYYVTVSIYESSE